MTVQTGFTLHGRNPDILTCIANLSNDEVFTPPEFANQMLDQLAAAWAADNDGANIWADPTVTFLDPFTKSGVFLREITSRLVDGLATEIPDLEERVDHILTKQVFGIAITQLTALLARRTLYCSKSADGKYSIGHSFDSPEGNIWFQKTEHDWIGATTYVETSDAKGNPIRVGTNGKCRFCGASQKNLDRGDELETHAYAFIHTDNIDSRIQELFGDKMQFDVIIGNPPYQLSDGGFGASATPIYDRFVDQAMSLAPRYLTMVIPARWFTGGKGLDGFRETMLGDRRIRRIEDFLNSTDAFPGVELQGGICVFLWSRDHEGDCTVTTHYGGQEVSTLTRPLLEPGSESFIRYNDAISIVRKIMEVETGNSDAEFSLPEGLQFMRLVSSRKAFGLPTTFRGESAESEGLVKVYQFGGVSYTERGNITAARDVIDRWKVFIGGAHGGHGHGKDVFPTVVLGKPFVGEPGSASTETYLFIGPLKDLGEVQSVISYMRTRLFRLLVLLNKPAQHATKKVYTFVPVQDWSRPWTDADLYEKYGITDDEIGFIESLVRPMEIDADA